MKAFRPDAEAVFLERPNRYIVKARIDREIVTAHCPNPGRMEELLIPGCSLILQKADNPERKTAWSLEAVRYNKHIIPLNSTGSNRLAGHFLSDIYGNIESARSEYTLGKSRFDWMFRQEEKDSLLEVKSCTLVAENRAMFPDAPSVRALKHLTHLAEQNKFIPRVLFMVFNPEAESFTPNRHTDPALAIAVNQYRHKIDFRACSLECSEQGDIELINPGLELKLPRFEPDSGIYLIVLELEEKSEITVSNGNRFFLHPGFYVYTGSARKNLNARISRHKRIRKKKHWHLDYLRENCRWIKAYPIVTRNDLECQSASLMDEIADSKIKGFGCTDCDCESHLFFFHSNPIQTIQFQKKLLLLRHKLAF